MLCVSLLTSQPPIEKCALICCHLQDDQEDERNYYDDDDDDDDDNDDDDDDDDDDDNVHDDVADETKVSFLNLLNSFSIPP